MNDKLASATLLGGYGFPVIPVITIFAPSLRLPAPPCQVLKTDDALRVFLREPAHYPLFGKPSNALQSLGSMSFDADVAERKSEFASLQQATRRQMRDEGRTKLQRVTADVGKS